MVSRGTTWVLFFDPYGMISAVGIGTYELASPRTNLLHLLDDLRFEIPRQDEDVVWLQRIDRLRRPDRQSGAGQEEALFVGRAIDGEFQKVRAYSAVVEQRVAFGGRAIADDRLPFALQADEQRQ